MLSISLPLKGAGAGRYYLELAQEDYYANRAEAPGYWFGTGAARLGLPGEVQPAVFRNLLTGFSPDGQTPLVQNAGNEHRQSGWDLTFSPPKGLSVLWGVGPESTRPVFERIHRKALERALARVEEEAGITRRGPGGAIKEEAALVFACFQHRTSRAQDPQLHTHAVLINLGVREDGTTGTLDSRELFRLKMIIGALYRRELAAGLEHELHLKTVPERVGFRIEGVPPSICRLFSKRRRSIERILSGRDRRDAVAAKAVTLETRPHKQRVGADELFAAWQRVGRQFGWGQAEAAQLLKDCAQGHYPGTASRGEIKDEDVWRGLPDFQEAQPGVGQQARGQRWGGDPSDRTAQDRAGASHRDDGADQKSQSTQTEGRSGWGSSDQRDSSRQDREQRQRSQRASARDSGRNRARYADQMFEEEFWRQAEFIPNWRRNRGKVLYLARSLAHQFGASKQTLRRVIDEFAARPTLDQRYRFQFGWRRLFPEAPFWSPASPAKIPWVTFPKPQPKWGEIYRKRGFFWGELRIQQRKLFADAPGWSFARGKGLPALRVVFRRSQAAQEAKHPWRTIRWEGRLARAKVRLQQKRVFPRAPKWSPAHRVEAPAVRFVKTDIAPTQDARHSGVGRQSYSQ